MKLNGIYIADKYVTLYIEDDIFCQKTKRYCW